MRGEEQRKISKRGGGRNRHVVRRKKENEYTTLAAEHLNVFSIVDA